MLGRKEAKAETQRHKEGRRRARGRTWSGRFGVEAWMSSPGCSATWRSKALHGHWFSSVVKPQHTASSKIPGETLERDYPRQSCPSRMDNGVLL